MTLSSDDYQESLRRFAERAPELLARHGATAPLAMSFARLELIAQLERRQFTVAVVGRMKAGKSTLLNALVGRPLAAVGVDETTATVNLFDHGRGEIEDSFEIHWKDEARPVERRPLGAIAEFTGNSLQAESVGHLRFFTASPFLEGIRLVDLPGTMSTIEAHESATLGFIAGDHGERADATVLALPPVVTKADQQAMIDFAEQTRLPGQGPYNTIAVLQKWETLNAAAPEAEAERLAANFRARLSGQVADVLPVSGLMAIMARNASGEDLDRLAFLASRCSEADLEGLAMEERFKRDQTVLALDGEERRALLARLDGALLGPSSGKAAGAFEMLRFAVGLAHRKGLSDGERLRTALAETSNIDRLREVLEQRFFTVSSLIRAGSVLRKAMEPCQTALFTLRHGLDGRRELVDEGKTLRAALADAPADPLSQAAAGFLGRCLPLLDEQSMALEETLRELDPLVDLADRDFKLLVGDMDALNALRAEVRGFDDSLKESARRLFGQFGMERHARLGLDPAASVQDQIDRATVLHGVFAPLSWTSRIAEHAEERLNRILDDLMDTAAASGPSGGPATSGGR